MGDIGAVLAVDVGGTRTKLALVSAHGDVDRLTVVDTPGTADAALAAVIAAGRDVLDLQGCAGVGLCVPGLVDDDGRITALPGKLDGIVGRDLPGELTAAFGVPALVVNDAIAYGAGEAAAGAGSGAQRVVVLTVGTGVGVAVLEAGRPIGSGPLGGGLQGGQIPIGTGDQRWLDTSGHADTIEAHCRALRLVDYAVAAGGRYDDVPAVLSAYARSEPAAVGGVERFRAALVLAVRALANAHGADVVVVGGGPLSANDVLLDGVEASVQEQLWDTHRVVVRRAALGDTAALRGVDHLVRYRLRHGVTTVAPGGLTT